MVRLGLAVSLLTAAAVQAVVPAAPEIVPGAYIIEYEDDQNSATFVPSINRDAELRKDLRFKLFKGASIQFSDVETADIAIAKFAQSPRIKNVWPVKRYSVPKVTVHSTGNGAGFEEALLNKRQSGNDTFSPHVQTQINKFRDAGITGQGIKVAIIDTGVDYLHPALGGCFGPGCLVSYGYDLAGDSYTGQNKPTPDGDPLDTCNGHGTHVAGIIAAQANPYGIIGGATGVTLGAYRVFGCEGNVDNDILIAAYNMAYEAGSDIITASIGGPSGWADDPWAAVVSRIVEHGVPCVVSAGNDGSTGLFFPSTAANGRRVTAIGSIDNSVSPALLTNASYTVDTSGVKSFGFTVGDPPTWTDIKLPLWAVNFNTTDAANGCDPYPASTPNLSGRIVLIRRGTCTFVQKVTNAVAKGAKYVLFYNNVAGSATVSARVAGLSAVAMVTAEQGAQWIKELEAGGLVTVSMPNPTTAPKFLANFENSASGGSLSGFTSWGPTFEVELKPQFSAPGGLILSTYPRALGAYAVLSGTSMSCPLVAATYALLMNARGTKDPKTLENILSATAKPARYQPGSGTPLSQLLAPVPQQGAGVIQAWDAAYSTTVLSTSSISFNDTDHFIPVQNFSISNTGKTDIVYRLDHEPAATGYTFANETTPVPAVFPVDVNDNTATISFSISGNFTIPAGQRKLVSVTAKAPSGLIAKRLPVYSGYVVLAGSDGSTLRLPYIGVVGSLHGVAVLDAAGTRLSRSTDRTNAAVLANSTFTLPPAGHANDTLYVNRAVLPKIVVSLSMGSSLIRAEAVPLGGAAGNAKNATMVLGTDTVGQIGDFPARFQPRGSFDMPWTGRLNDGSYVQPGRYKIVIKALKIFGDPSLASEYEVTETVPFNIVYGELPRRRAESF